MPVLRPPVSGFVRNARFTSADLVSLRAAIRDRTATLQDAKNIAIFYADTLEPGVGSWLKKLMVSLGSTANVEFPIPDLARDPALLNGQTTLPDSDRRHPAVRNVQRALMALASRTGQLAYMLPSGADGDYGAETTAAVKAFQQRNGLQVTGKVEMKTARSLNQALLRTQTPGIMQAQQRDLARAATELCAQPTALNYGVPQPWVNIDPQHNVPVGRAFNDLKDRWKCNLFGGNVLRQGGYEPPYYGNQGKGEYPNANQWHKWSNKYAPGAGNKVHFQLVAEVPLLSLSSEAARVAIADLLGKAQLGDCLMEDHPGSQVADGGHTRVTVGNTFHLNGSVAFAQAQFTQAGIRQEGVDDLMGGENLWLLRPVVKM